MLAGPSARPVCHAIKQSKLGFLSMVNFTTIVSYRCACEVIRGGLVKRYQAVCVGNRYFWWVGGGGS